jgi:acyl-CoA synthetase (NDP forming)/RimJ/RimL family protein N-acetyltransferase
VRPIASDSDRWEADVVLSDGGVVHLRAVRPDDGDRMVAFHQRQSPEALYYRYFSPKPTLTADEVASLVSADDDHMGFVALVDDAIVGVGRYDRFRGANEAEVAFMVDGDHWGRGLATLLLEYLVAAGREAGFAGFAAQVLPDNRRMLTVLDKAGFDAHRQFADGVIEVELSLDPSAAADAAIESREQRAEARSVARLLWPSAVAVIADPGPVGEPARQAFAYLVGAGFPGPVHRVGGEAAWDEPAAARIEDVPDAVDLTVMALEPDDLHAAVEACARKGVRGAVLLTPAAEAPADLVALARRSGMRLVGPGSVGVVNTDPAARLHASSLDVVVPAGPIGFLSQSGTLARALVERAAAAGLGFSNVVAVGDKADLSANDLLQYWEHDDATQVVALYLQAFGNPRKFSRIARRVSRVKPIVAVKSGRARVEPGGDEWPDDMLDALLTQTGVIRVDTTEELLDVARVLASQPVPEGHRVAVVANAQGPAVLAADAAVGAGLMVERSVDLDREAGPADYADACATALDDTADAVLVVHAPGAEDVTAEVLEAVGLAAAADGKPVVATVVGQEPDGGGDDVPVFAFPERAARALARVAAYGAWRARPAGVAAEFDDGAPDDARALVDAVLAASPSGRLLEATETEELLSAFGLRTPPQRAVHTAEGAAEAAAAVGFPVTLKALGLDQLGKVEAGGVALDLNEADDVRAAFDRMAERLGDAMRPALVQHMVEPGADIQIQLHQHPRWGSTISVGVGGAVARALDEGVQRVVPLTDLDAKRLVDASAACRIIDDSGRSADRVPLEDALLRLSWLADALPEVATMQLNPVIVSPDVAWVTSARARVRPWIPDPDPRLRRL